eukprot:350160-Chlamydomonas_euryale.AAC.3
MGAMLACEGYYAHVVGWPERGIMLMSWVGKQGALRSRRRLTWLVDGPIVWLVGGPIVRLVGGADCLAGWWADCSAGWWAACLAGWWADWLAGCVSALLSLPQCGLTMTCRRQPTSCPKHHWMDGHGEWMVRLDGCRKAGHRAEEGHGH